MGKQTADSGQLLRGSVVLAVPKLVKFALPTIIANYVQIQMNYGEHAYVHRRAVLPTIYNRTRCRYIFFNFFRP